MTEASGASQVVSPAAPFASLRVLILHEWLYTYGGAERVLDEILALIPHAELRVSVIAPQFRAHPMALRARESWLGWVPGARRHHRWFLPLQAAAFASMDTRGYDLVISSSHAFAKLARSGPRTTHVCYCYSPPRWLYDLRDSYLEGARGIQGIALRTMTPAMRQLDRAGASGVDRFIGISRHVADRIARHYGREAPVVYPPVAPKPGGEAPQRREDFLFTIGRMVPYKRVDLAIRAAERLGMRLVVAGDGPELRHLRAMAGRNTEFVGAVDERTAGELYSRCAAFLFCAEEDFGIAPLEANAHGAPVVAYGRGGAAETMVDGVTGVLFAEQSVESVTEAIRECVSREWDAGVMRENARRFRPERFRRDFADAVIAALAGAR